MVLYSTLFKKYLARDVSHSCESALQLIVNCTFNAHKYVLAKNNYIYILKLAK